MKTNGRIIVNGRYLNQRLTGVQRYASELVRYLQDELLILKPPDHRLAGPLWEQLILPAKVSSQDLLWSPTNTGPLILSNQVVTIHDLSTIDHPEWFSRRFSAWYQFILPRLAHRVRRIITVSQFSKNRIMEQFKVPESKVVVAHLGVGDHFKRMDRLTVHSILRKYQVSEPYVLTVGSLEPRKNLFRLIQAWNQLMPKNNQYRLVIIGSMGYPFKKPDLGELGRNIQMLGHLNDADLPAFYSGATAFAYPSVYEGFGLPVLEAMACGTPVIASNAASIPEAAGEAALLFDPFEITEISNCLEKVLWDEEFRRELSAAGVERAQKMTWSATAQIILGVLKEESSRNN